MKLLGIFFTLFLILSSCSHHAVKKDMTYIDSILYHEKYDSAALLLEKVKPYVGKYGEDRAYYNLLFTRISYLKKQQCPEKLIDYSIDYYNRTGDKQKLADCYCYKANYSSWAGNSQETIKYLKKSESLMLSLHNPDKFIMHKVYEYLCCFNMDMDERNMTLKYAHKTLDYSCGIKKWITYAYSYITVAHICLGNEDSIKYYMNKFVPLMNKYMPVDDRAYYYADFGLMYLKSDTSKCKYYINKVKSMKQNYVTPVLLSQYYLQKGDTANCRRMLEKAYSLSPEKNKISVLDFMIDMYLGDNQKDVIKLIDRRDSAFDAMRNKHINETQRNFDYQLAKMKINERIAYGVGAFIIIALMIAALYYYRKSKYDRLRKVLSEKQALLENYLRQKNGYKLKFRDNEITENEYEKKMEILEGKIASIEKVQMAMYQEGRKLYEEIENGNNTSLWKKSDFVNFNLYYKFIDMELVAEIESSYDSLSPKQLFIVIMQRTMHNDKKVIEVMAFSDSAYRSAKSRIKAKAKTQN